MDWISTRMAMVPLVQYIDKDTYSAFAEDIEVQSSRMIRSEKAVSSKRCLRHTRGTHVMESLRYMSAPTILRYFVWSTGVPLKSASRCFVALVLPMLHMRVGSIEPFENPLDTRKLESSSYHALGACLSPYKAFLRRKDVLIVDRKYAGLSAACTAEDFDTTGEFPLINSLNIGLYSNSSSFDVVTVSCTLRNIFLDFVDRDETVLSQTSVDIDDRGLICCNRKHPLTIDAEALI
ncbi:hypothetical protein Tco_1294836 [Tanacetum coccineum]